jgi:hypothetical protein
MHLNVIYAPKIETVQNVDTFYRKDFIVANATTVILLIITLVSLVLVVAHYAAKEVYVYSA